MEGHDELLAIWSKPEINHGNSPVQAKLGATGLGLVALLSVEKIQPGETPLEDLRRLGQFLIFMQKEDGGFHSKYIPSQNGRTDKWTSLYYPGEAALGLVMLYEKDPDAKWLEAAAKAIGYLAKQRAGRRRVEADHWALIATSKLLPLYDRIAPPVPRALIERSFNRRASEIRIDYVQHALSAMLDFDRLAYGSAPTGGASE